DYVKVCKDVFMFGGIILGVSPLLFVVMIVTFMLTLYLSKYVSLSSMITGIVSFIVSLFLKDIGLMFVIATLTVFVFYRHTDNIKSIKIKTEPKITWQ